MDSLNGLQQPSSGFSFDPRTLEIKTKSIEQTLVPLVSQISTLVNFKENVITGNKPKSERALRAAMKIGTSLAAAVERFATVGETIADENPDIQPEMYDACTEARMAGSSIANINNSLIDDNGVSVMGVDKSQLVRASRQLLSSVTRVLLLADRVVVKNILRAEDKIAYSLTKLENTSNFTEFVKIFTEFGAEMVALAHRSGERQHDLKSEKRRAQITVARSNLERMTMLLLTASKTLLRHPENSASKKCRDGVFHEIRLSLQLIAICVTDGVMPLEPTRYCMDMDPDAGPLDIGMQLTANVSIKQLMEMLEMVRMTSAIGPSTRERLIAALVSLCEMTQDFTESSFTLHHHREQILDFLEECRFEMNNLITPDQNGSLEDDQLQQDSLEVTVERLNRRLRDLQKQLQLVAMDQVSAIFRANEDHTVLTSMKTCSVSGDIDGVEKYLEKFREHAEHVQDVCRLLHHISMTDGLHVATGHAERNLRALAPLTLLAGQTLCVHPSSRIARENLEVFCDTWAQNINDLSKLAKELDATSSGRVAASAAAYMSLPRMGVSPPRPFPKSLAISLSRHNLSSNNSSTSALPMLFDGDCKDNNININNSIPCVNPNSNCERDCCLVLSPNLNSTAMTQSGISSGYGSSSTAAISTKSSAFIKYQKPTLNSPKKSSLQLPGTSKVENEEFKAPLADEENSSIGSATSEEKKAFEYRIGLIMNSLEEQAQNLLKIAEGYD
uniref:Alpha-catenin n=1 Tax=Panagrolaimus sp. PS1159 TaxID=55785 RepID=A0AC35F3B3_9BILA